MLDVPHKMHQEMVLATPVASVKIKGAPLVVTALQGNLSYYLEC